MSVENVCPGVTVDRGSVAMDTGSVAMDTGNVTMDTGNVAKPLRKKCVIGKKSLLHRTSDNSAEEGRSTSTALRKDVLPQQR